VYPVDGMVDTNSSSSALLHPKMVVGVEDVKVLDAARSDVGNRAFSTTIPLANWLAPPYSVLQSQ
jgi:hypothetical protein